MGWIKKHYKLLILLTFILLLLPEVYLYPLFLLVIKPAGEKKIDEIVGQVDGVNDTLEKLERIAGWEVRDFTNTYNRRPDFTLDVFFRYPVYFDRGIKVRALNPLIPEFLDNPYWIAFFKVGGCGELASLFDDVAKRSGVETRIVRTEGEDHTWVEFKIDGEWVHVDPTLYFINYRYNQSIKWFDNPRFYDSHWFSVSKVFVKETREDITGKYTDVGLLKISLVEPADRIVVKTMKNGRQREVVSLKVNSLEVEVELGGKRYNVTAEKDLVPYFIVLQDTKEIKVIEGRWTVVELSPYNLGFKPPFYLVLLFTMSFGIALITKRRKVL